MSFNYNPLGLHLVQQLSDLGTVGLEAQTRTEMDQAPVVQSSTPGAAFIADTL